MHVDWLRRSRTGLALAAILALAFGLAATALAQTAAVKLFKIVTAKDEATGQVSWNATFKDRMDFYGLKVRLEYPGCAALSMGFITESAASIFKPTQAKWRGEKTLAGSRTVCNGGG